jgi:hypothetical protein
MPLVGILRVGVVLVPNDYMKYVHCFPLSC